MLSVFSILLRLLNHSIRGLSKALPYGRLNTFCQVRSERRKGGFKALIVRLRFV